MTGLPPSNYTQMPNVLIDEMMRDMSFAELKVMLVAIRLTLGWQKRVDAISLSQFQEYTGLCRQAVLDGIDAAKQRGILTELDERGPRGVKQYAVVFSGDQSTQATSSGLSSRPEPVYPVDTQKKGKERERNNFGPASKSDTDETSISPPVEPQEGPHNTSPIAPVMKRLEALGIVLSGFQLGMLKEALEDLSHDAVIAAIDEAVKRRKPNWNYINGILNNKRNEARALQAARDKAKRRDEAVQPAWDKYAEQHRALIMGVNDEAAA